MLGINIKNMDIDTPGLLIICGLQGGGKSHYIKSLMYERRKKFDWGIVFSNTGWGDGNFDYVPEACVYEHYDEKRLENLKALQKKCIKAGRRPHAFVIFDDCLEKKQWESEALLSLSKQVRHYNITCIISTQFPSDIPNTYRNQIFQVALFKMNNRFAVQSMYDSFGQMFESCDEFKRSRGI
eukprot:TRINITY_DN279_c0_g3_i2.p1 TRINITY_DN279_c0_g3~~TRINITY_DN279_c0_g3_i2.p1  ORF type:complete len:182 (+),score=20.28 TRINITY_DN279_c0_g3_i2:335-880(+)